MVGSSRQIKHSLFYADSMIRCGYDGYWNIVVEEIKKIEMSKTEEIINNVCKIYGYKDWGEIQIEFKRDRISNERVNKIINEAMEIYRNQG